MRELHLQWSCPWWIKRAIWCSYFYPFIPLWAQQVEHVRVVDPSGEPIPYASAYDIRRGDVYLADVNGEVHIPYRDVRDSFEFRHVGYVPLRLTIADIRRTDNTVRLQPFVFGTVHVVGRAEMRSDELPYEIQTVRRAQLLQTPSTQTDDVLEIAAGVFVQKSQGGAASPILRGFEANKLLLVVDGIRMNNAMFRSGHMHQAISVSPLFLQRIEVLFGPNSLIYGSDALGGVIHFVTKSPKLSPDSNSYSKAAMDVRAASATGERSAFAQWEYRSPRFGTLTALHFQRYGHIRAGNVRSAKYPDFGKRWSYVQRIDHRDTVLANPNPNVQIPSGYRQLHFVHAMKYHLASQVLLEGQLQWSYSPEVPRYDQLSLLDDGVPKWAEWSYRPQERKLLSIALRHLRPTLWWNKLRVIGYYQGFTEGRAKRKFRSDLAHVQLERLHTTGFTLDAERKLALFEEAEVYYGMHWRSERLWSEAHLEHLSTGERFYTALTRYPDGGNTVMAGGVYNVWHLRLDEQWRLHAGWRWTAVVTHMRYADSSIVRWPDDYYRGLRASQQAWTWSLGVLREMGKYWQWRFLAGNAFHAPNVDDMAKIRIKGDEILVPNPSLRPESSLSFEIGTQVQYPFYKGQLRFSSTLYHHFIRQLIVRRPFALPNGDTLWTVQGSQYRVVSQQNAQSGKVRGISIKLEYRHPHWTTFASVDYLNGRVREGNATVPMAHIPPLYGRVGVRYQRALGDKRRWSIEGVWRFNGQKPAEEYAPSSSDNLTYATPEGTPAWSVWDIQMQWHGKRAYFGFGVQNVGDLHYRPFSSGISAPGRNYFVRFGLQPSQ